MSARDALKPIPDDGMLTPSVHEYAKDKYALLHCYASIFTTAMKSKWENLAYIDLFAAAGASRIEDTSTIVRSSALLALNVRDPFTHYVFCEIDPEKLEALRSRVERSGTEASCCFLQGDANELVEDIAGSLPDPRGDNRLLCFCFADPSRMSDLRFSTVRRLARRYVDFLVLIPTGMEGRFIDSRYASSESRIVADFTGKEDWRRTWERSREKGESADLFLAGLYARQMRDLGYQYGGIDHSVAIRHPEKRFVLYRLGFFSRSQLGGRLFRQAATYSSTQTDLFGD